MKKVVILLAVTIACSFIAESAFAQTWQERRQDRQQERQDRLQERRGGPADTAAGPSAAAGQADACDSAGGTVSVYRRTLRGDYRQTSRVCAGNLEAPFSDCPDHEYILVRTFFKRYQWTLAHVDNIIAN
ncbi:MAG: hypothetical protein FWG73_00405 [Planctomycetaceae bacterium]|nr:hypothetical protein [Planctomycetaceae bacterium]